MLQKERSAYPLAVILPLLAAVPVVPVVMLLRQWRGIELFPGGLPGWIDELAVGTKRIGPLELPK